MYLYKIRDVHNSLVGVARVGVAIVGVAIVGIAVVGVVVVTHRSSLFSMMERNNIELQIQQIASVQVKVSVKTSN